MGQVADVASGREDGVDKADRAWGGERVVQSWLGWGCISGYA